MQKTRRNGTDRIKVPNKPQAKETLMSKTATKKKTNKHLELPTPKRCRLVEEEEKGGGGVQEIKKERLRKRNHQTKSLTFYISTSKESAKCHGKKTKGLFVSYN